MVEERERILSKRYVNIMFADLLQRICNSMLGALLPLYMVDMGYPKSVAGLTLTVYMLVAVVFRPVVGRLVDTRGRWGPLFIGTAVFLVGSAFFSASIPLPLFFVMRGLQGMGFAFIGTAIMTMATDIIPRQRMSEGIGYLGLGQTISRAFFPVIALSLKDAFGYTTTYIVIFAIGFLDLLVALALRERQKRFTDGVVLATSEEEIAESQSRTDRAQVKERLWERLVDRDALKPSSILLVTMFASSSTMAFVIVYAVAKGIPNAGIFFTASAIAIAVGRLSVGRVSQKFGSAAVIAPGLVLSSVSMLVLFWLDGIGILILSGVLAGLAGGMVQPELQSLAVLLAREERRGSANSTLYMMMDIGTASGALVWGVVADHTGLGFIFLAASTLVFVALLFYLFFNRRGVFRVPDRGMSAQLSGSA